MGNKLIFCSTPTDTSTKILGDVSFMSGLDPNKQELRRATFYRKEKCGTHMDYPVSDIWMQCLECYSKTCTKYGFKEHQYKKQSLHKLHDGIHMGLNLAIQKFFNEVKQMIQGATIIRKMKDVTIFTTDEDFKVDFQNQIPHQDYVLAKMLTKILKRQTSSERLKRIRKVYLSKRRYGVIRIDMFAYPGHSEEDSTFALGWGVVLSEWSKEIDPSQWEKEEEGLIRPKLEMYCEADIQEYSPHY